MDVDEVEDEVRANEVPDYGIEVDFTDLEEDDQEVSLVLSTIPVN
jgi:hypothetical protein